MYTNIVLNLMYLTYDGIIEYLYVHIGFRGPTGFECDIEDVKSPTDGEQIIDVFGWCEGREEVGYKQGKCEGCLKCSWYLIAEENVFKSILD